MKKILVWCCLLLLGGLATAQTHRFVYEYKYVPVLDKKDSVVTELMALDIDASGSKFENLQKIQRDSIMRATIEQTIKSGSRNIDLKSLGRFTGTSAYVTKEYAGGKTYYHDRISAEQYKVLENEKLTWKILPETQTVAGYKAQKATTFFGGRNWTAWFSTELPFQDGPYKFSGLPGLIVKLDDATQTHGFTLVANKKMPAAEKTSSEFSVGSGSTRLSFMRKEMEVSETQFQKAYQNYLADPAGKMRDIAAPSPGGGSMMSGMVIMAHADGNKMDRNEMIRNMENRAKKLAATQWNRLEWGLYELAKK